MFSTMTEEKLRSFLELPTDYAVEGFLACGTWDLYADKHLGHLEDALSRLGISAVVKRLENKNLGHAFELTIDGKVYWFAPVMGSCVMAAYAHAASLLGSKKNLLVGTVGGLRAGVRPGNFILPTAARGNENALMYQRDARDLMFYPDRALVDSLKRRLPSDSAVIEGPTVTCEVMLAETWQDVEQWSSEGYVSVEMEAALIFGLSNRFRVPSAALLFVSDNLIERVTKFDDEYSSSKESRDNARIAQYGAAIGELIGR